MAPGQVIRVEDLPPEMRLSDKERQQQNDWENGLRVLAEQRLAQGEYDLLKELSTSFERILIEAALKHSGGRKQDAAKKLGWGRNTLTRKLKEFDL